MWWFPSCASPWFFVGYLFVSLRVSHADSCDSLEDQRLLSAVGYHAPEFLCYSGNRLLLIVWMVLTDVMHLFCCCLPCPSSFKDRRGPLPHGHEHGADHHVFFIPLRTDRAS